MKPPIKPNQTKPILFSQCLSSHNIPLIKPLHTKHNPFSFFFLLLFQFPPNKDKTTTTHTSFTTITSHPFLFTIKSIKLYLQIHQFSSTYTMQMMQGSSSSSMFTTVSKDENFVFSSEDSSRPDDSHLQLGLGLSLSSPSTIPPTSAPPYARILTAKDFPSSSASSSSSSSSLNRKCDVTSGTKRAADSVVTTNASRQVVGWPPLRTYRMNSRNNNSKSPDAEVFNSMVDKSKSNIAVGSSSDKNNIVAKEKGNLRGSLFVKVNKDGALIGRKVDLSAHSSYETLAQNLEDMFNEPNTITACKGSNHGITAGVDGKSKLLDGSSNFVLTYEDKEGDWMLVGDVPWWMFLSSVRRLKIMRTSEANGLAPRLEENSSKLKNKHI